MTEFFELIMAKPLEFIVGLGVSSATIYSIITLIKFIFSLIMRNKSKLKQAVERTKIASAVADKLNLNNQFQDLKKDLKDYVDSSIKDELQKIFEVLSTLKERPDCPDELKIFIETLKNQEGNEEFAFFYDQNAKRLESREKLPKAEQIVDECEDKVQEEEQASCEQNDDEKGEPFNPNANDDEDIDYA